MTRYALRRLLVFPFLVLAVTFVTFTLGSALPGDPVLAIAGEKASPEEREEIRRRLGLDRPFLVRYVGYLGRLARGDLGESYVRRGRPVSRELIERFPATIELTIAAMFLAVLSGISVGIWSAMFRGRWPDTLGMTFSLLGLSVPVFWLGLILILVFGGILPTGSNLDPRMKLEPITRFVLLDALLSGRPDALRSALAHLALPALALSTIPMAIIARITRSSMLEVLNSDFVRTARAKGLPEDLVVLRHAFRNTLIPVLTIGGTQFGYLLGGAVLTETVFQWPGLGTYVVDAALNSDYNAMMGAGILMTLTFLVVNLVVDLLYAWADPRVAHGTA